MPKVSSLRSITASVPPFCSVRLISAPTSSCIRRPSFSTARDASSAAPSLSAFNAWVLLKGLETLKIRLEAQSAKAIELARWLEAHPNVARVYYPGLESHPQYELARRQQKSGGAVVAFEVKGERAQAWKVIDACRLLSITANLGDTKTTLTHPATTTHGRITPEQRAASGITESLLRVAVGLEAVVDLQNDLESGLASL